MSLVFAYGKSGCDYEKWCVVNARLGLASGIRPIPTKAPKNDSDAWLSIVAIIEQFRHGIEYNRGWELLCSDSYPRDENAIQVAFYNFVEPLTRNLGIRLIREPETGRGPVDFELSNGISTRVSAHGSAGRGRGKGAGAFLADRVR